MFNQQSMSASTFQSNAQNFNQWEEQYIAAVKKINEYRIARMATSVERLQQMCQWVQNDCDTFTDDDTSTVG